MLVIKSENELSGYSIAPSFFYPREGLWLYYYTVPPCWVPNANNRHGVSEETQTRCSSAVQYSSAMACTSSVPPSGISYIYRVGIRGLSDLIGYEKHQIVLACFRSESVLVPISDGDWDAIISIFVAWSTVVLCMMYSKNTRKYVVHQASAHHFILHIAHEKAQYKLWRFDILTVSVLDTVYFQQCILYIIKNNWCRFDIFRLQFQRGTLTSDLLYQKYHVCMSKQHTYTSRAGPAGWPWYLGKLSAIYYMLYVASAASDLTLSGFRYFNNEWSSSDLGRCSTLLSITGYRSQIKYILAPLRPGLFFPFTVPTRVRNSYVSYVCLPASRVGGGNV